MNDNIEILGKGLAFNFGVDSNGGIKFSSYEKSVEEGIDIILSTKPGERVYNRKFGCLIQDLMFEPNNSETKNLAARYVKYALDMFEKRINVLSVEAQSEDEKSINIIVNYKLIESNREYNLVYPFYLLPQ